MERKCYIKILQVNLKHNFVIPLITTLLVGGLMVLLFNIKALSKEQAMQPIELLLCFTGITMLTPVFLPEQNPAIRDVICSKKIEYSRVCLIRLIYSVVTVLLVNVLFIGIMKAEESEVGLYHVVAAITGALFLGAIGFFVSGITGNTTLGYMLAIGYYLVNYSVKDKFGIFNLFTGIKGTYSDKMWILMWAVLLVIITFVWMYVRRKR